MTTIIELSPEETAFTLLLERRYSGLQADEPLVVGGKSMNAMELIVAAEDIPQGAEAFVHIGNRWYKVDSIDALQDGEVSGGRVVAEIRVSPCEPPLEKKWRSM